MPFASYSVALFSGITRSLDNAVVYRQRAANECGLLQVGGALEHLLSAGLGSGVHLPTPLGVAGRGHKSPAEEVDP